MSTSLKCPLTGEPVKVKAVKGGPLNAIHWYGIVSSPKGGYTTTMFQTEEHLIDFLKLRGGELVGKSAQPSIEVKHPDLFAGQVEDENQKERDADDMSKISASRAVKRARDTGVIKPAR